MQATNNFPVFLASVFILFLFVPSGSSTDVAHGKARVPFQHSVVSRLRLHGGADEDCQSFESLCHQKASALQSNVARSFKYVFEEGRRMLHV
jgi:hypothetical protein